MSGRDHTGKLLTAGNRPGTVQQSSAGPDASWIVGQCPECNGPVVANTYYVGGRGDLHLLECWTYLEDKFLPRETRRCDWTRRV